MTDRKIKAAISASQFYYLNKDLTYARQRVCYFKRKIRECSDSEKIKEYMKKQRVWEDKVKSYSINHI